MLQGWTAPSIRSYEFLGGKWPDSSLPVPYCVNPSGIPVSTTGQQLMSSDAFVNLVRMQFARWQGLPDSYFSARFTGTCFNDPRNQHDGVNTVGWGRLPGSAGGVTLPGGAQETPYRLGFGSSFSEVDIIIDDRILESLDLATAGNHIIPVIVLHEIGHFVGLAHSNRGCSVMTPSSLQLEFCDDDIAGVRALYPGPERASALSVGETSCGPGGGIDATFRWTPSAEADGYYFDITLDPAFGGWLGLYAGGRADSALRLGGMLPGTPHYWRVFSFAGAGGGHSLGPSFVTPFCFGGGLVPAGPADLRVEASCSAGTISASFGWSQSLAADAYFIDLTLDPGFGGYVNAFVPGMGFTWGGLLPNADHYFRVFAFNANGGSHSYVGAFRTPPPC